MLPGSPIAAGLVRRSAFAAATAAYCIAACVLIQARPAEAKETPDAREWLDRAVQAAGGESVVYGCRTLIVKSESERRLGSERLAVETTTYLRFPLSVRQEIVVGGNRLAMASTPDEAFLVTDQGPVLLNQIARRSIELPAMRNPVSLLKARRSLYFDARFQGQGKVDDRDVGFVEIRMGQDVTTVAISSETGRIVRETYDSYGEGDAGRKGTMVVRFDDFRALPSGLAYPHRAKGELDGAFEFESRVEEVRVNDTIDPALFVSGLTRPRAAAGLPQQPRVQ